MSNAVKAPCLMFAPNPRSCFGIPDLQSFGWQWTPVLDTLKVSKNKRDRFWPVGVVTGKLLAATLKGGEEHPAAYPRPVLTGGCPWLALLFLIGGGGCCCCYCCCYRVCARSV